MSKTMADRVRSVLNRLLGSAIEQDLGAGLNQERELLAAQTVEAGEDPDPDSLSNAETKVSITAFLTALLVLLRSFGPLTRVTRRLVRAAHRSMSARSRLTDARADSRKNYTPVPPTGPGQPAADGTNERFDRWRPLIKIRDLLILEIVYVIAEIYFWFSTFTESLDADAGLFDPHRLSALLLAVLLPLAGVTAVNILGRVGHRWVAGYGVDRRAKFGTVFALFLTAVSGYATFVLVHGRFEAGNSALGATQLPSFALALVFLVVMVADAGARIFLTSEIRTQSEEWTKHVGGLREGVLRANEKHVHAWNALRGEITVQLLRSDRLAGTGVRLILSSRAESVPARPVPAIVGPHTARSSPLPDTTGLKWGAKALWHGPLRSLEEAVKVLGEFAPPNLELLSKETDEVVDQLLGTAKTGPGPATIAMAKPAGMPSHNGHAITETTEAQR